MPCLWSDVREQIYYINTKFNQCGLLFYCRLELNMELPGGEMGTIGASTQVSQEQDELTQRLARLRQV